MFEKTIMISSSFSLKKYVSFIILFSLLLLISGVVWFGIIPLKQSTVDKARGIQEFYAREENQKKQMDQLPKLENQYTTITRNESTLDILLREDQVVDFIKTLEEIASEMNVQMTITSEANGQIIESKKIPAKTVSSTTGDAGSATSTNNTKSKAVNILDDIPYDRYLRLTIKAEGRYTNIVGFLQKVETLPIGLDVVGMEMKKVDVTKKTTAPQGTNSNPFSFVGSGDTASLPPSDISTSDLLEGTFEILIYMKK